MVLIGFFCALLFLPLPSIAIPGDINQDGTVNFDDFFILADNFGKKGPPQIIDTTRVTIFDTLKVEIQSVIYDTLVIDRATVYDTIFFGREPIRLAPPPPPSQIAQAQVIKSALITRGFSTNIIGEIYNPSTASLSDVRLRLTVRNNGGLVLFTETFTATYRLLAGDTRAFSDYILSSTDAEILDNIRAGNSTFDVSWGDEIKQINNVSLGIKPNSLVIADPFALSGEVENTSESSVQDFTIYFYGRDHNGNPFLLDSFGESTFGIPPGGSSPFSIDKEYLGSGEYMPKSDVAELYYYIQWRWTTSSYSELEISPFTRVF